jgi:hypothetical protein
MMLSWKEKEAKQFAEKFQILVFIVSCTFYLQLEVQSILHLPRCLFSRLRDLDLEFLSKLCTKVNVIPVIAKADTLAPEEAQFYKKAVN